MLKKFSVLTLFLALLSPLAVFAQRRGAGGPGQRQTSTNRMQERKRIHNPGTGQQGGAAIRKRDRKRDGTGVNCPGGPCTGTPKATPAPKK